ncbi:MAG: T9SS type A sorting domain-containing protein [Flavobacteriales bacterium]|nr:T9SS type A sorting domain-containing protein [Flavobacteriales bacterium]
MKTTILLSLLAVCFCSNGQLNTIGFDTSQCAGSITINYTYQNYTEPHSSGSSTVDGFRIFKNGVQIYEKEGLSQQVPHWGHELIFINDSVGFFSYNVGPQFYVIKTSDYGASWQTIGQTSGTGDMYVFNENIVYLFKYYYVNNYEFEVWRLSDVHQSKVLISDPSMTTDHSSLDSLLSPGICPLNSISYDVVHNGDTLTYTINIDVINSIEQLAVEHSLKLYPNPSSSVVNFIGLKNSDVIIYNAQGAVVKRLRTNSTITQIDVSNWIKGYYYVQTLNETHSQIKFLVH